MDTPYIPFGIEWENEIKKMTKSEIIKLLKRSLCKNLELLEYISTELDNG